MYPQLGTHFLKGIEGIEWDAVVGSEALTPSAAIFHFFRARIGACKNKGPKGWHIPAQAEGLCEKLNEKR